MLSRTLVSAILSSAMAVSAAAQNPLWELRGTHADQRLGQGLRSFGDLDGDGKDEIAATYARGIRILRGSDGALVRTLDRAQGVLGDVDGDGVLDVWAAVRTPPEPSGLWTQTDVLSGADGSLLTRWPWSDTLGPLGVEFGAPIAFDDADGDGREDFLRVDWTLSPSSSIFSARLVSGRSGTVLRSHDDHSWVVPLNDVDGDGVAEYFLGQESSNPLSAAALISGSTGVTLASPAPPSLPTYAALATGDADGDGARDLAYVLHDSSTIVVSSVTGIVLHAFPELAGMSSDFQSVHGDLDGDGNDDLVLYDTAARDLVARSTSSGSVVQRYGVPSTSWLAGIGDLNSDARDDLIVGMPLSQDGRGRVLALTAAYSERVGTRYGFGDGTGAPCPCGAPGRAGEGCANSFGTGAMLSAWGSTSLAAANLSLAADGLTTDFNLLSDAILFSGAAASPAPPAIGNGLLAVRGPHRRLDRALFASWDAPSLPAWSSWLPGQTTYFQVWYRDDAALGSCGASSNTSNALAITFTP